MHISQLFFQFRRVVDFKGIVLGLPEVIPLTEVGEIIGSFPTIPFPKPNA